MEMIRSLLGVHPANIQPVAAAPARSRNRSRPSSLAAPLHSSAAPLLNLDRPPHERGPSFDPQLVPALLSDHIALLELIKRAGAAAATDNAQAAVKALFKFHCLLADHLLVENTRLYLYVRATWQTRAPESAQLSRAFQVEMNQITRSVTQFVETYTANERAVLGPAFMVDLDSIRQTLRSRFAREESTLYPMYTLAGLG